MRVVPVGLLEVQPVFHTLELRILRAFLHPRRQKRLPGKRSWLKKSWPGRVGVSSQAFCSAGLEVQEFWSGWNESCICFWTSTVADLSVGASRGS